MKKFSDLTDSLTEAKVDVIIKKSKNSKGFKEINIRIGVDLGGNNALVIDIDDYSPFIIDKENFVAFADAINRVKIN